MAGGHGARQAAPVTEQIAIACGQRGWNRQPDGGASRLGAAAAAGQRIAQRLGRVGRALSSSWV